MKLIWNPNECLDGSYMDGDMILSKYGQMNLDWKLKRDEAVYEIFICVFGNVFVLVFVFV